MYLRQSQQHARAGGSAAAAAAAAAAPLLHHRDRRVASSPSLLEGEGVLVLQREVDSADGEEQDAKVPLVHRRRSSWGLLHSRRHHPSLLQPRVKGGEPPAECQKR